MAKKRDLRAEIASRKQGLPPRAYNWFYHLVMKIMIKKHNCTFEIVDDINKCKTGAFLVFNHLSRLDHMYVSMVTYPRRFNMVASYNEFFRSHLYWAFKKQRIIPKKNYQNEVLATKLMMHRVKKGGVVAFSPEGLASNDGQNKPVVPGTGKLFKKVGVPVYYLELHGQYLQNTKPCLDERHGKVFAKLRVLFSEEDLKRLSGEEIDDIMNNEFRRDEYAWQREHHYKWEMFDRSCEGLGNLLYTCPKCGSMFTMKGEGNQIVCENCGNGATMDEYYDFHPLNDDCVIPEYTTPWVNKQRVDIIKAIRNDPNFAFEEEVEVGLIPNDHLLKDYKTTEVVAKGIIRIDHEGVHFKGSDTSEHDFDLDYRQIYTTFTVLDASFISFYVNGEHTDVFPKRRTAIYMNTLIEEMHRLHVNYYKNFPWNDWMYEEQ